MAKPSGLNTLHPSAAETTAGNSGPRAAAGAKLAVSVAVTAVSGTTPSCTFSVEWSPDGISFGVADPVDAFTAITTAVTRSKSFDVKAPFYRLVWTITGTTPSFTFLAAAVQV